MWFQRAYIERLPQEIVKYFIKVRIVFRLQINRTYIRTMSRKQEWYLIYTILGIYSKGGSCFICGKVDHLKQDCPKNPVN